jgi:hypothetical protein
MVGLTAVLAAALAVTYYMTPGHVPGAQPPLEVMDSPALAKLQNEFNRTAESVRLVLLLSPT